MEHLHIIENESLRIIVADHGAELVSSVFGIKIPVRNGYGQPILLCGTGMRRFCSHL